MPANRVTSTARALGTKSYKRVHIADNGVAYRDIDTGMAGKHRGTPRDVPTQFGYED